MTKKDREARKYLKKQQKLNLVILSNLKENCREMREEEYNKLRRSYSKTVILLDYIIMKL